MSETLTQQQRERQGFDDALEYSRENGCPVACVLSHEVVLVSVPDDTVVITQRMPWRIARKAALSLDQAISEAANFGRLHYRGETIHGHLWTAPGSVSLVVSDSGDLVHASSKTEQPPPSEEEQRFARELLFEQENQDTETDLEVPGDGVEPR